MKGATSKDEAVQLPKQRPRGRPTDDLAGVQPLNGITGPLGSKMSQGRACARRLRIFSRERSTFKNNLPSLRVRFRSTTNTQRKTLQLTSILPSHSGSSHVLAPSYAKETER